MNEEKLTVEECLKRAEFSKLHYEAQLSNGAERVSSDRVEEFWRKRAQELREAQEKSKPKRLCILCGRKRPEVHLYICEDCFRGGYYTLLDKLPGDLLNKIRDNFDRIANAPSAEKEKA